MLFILYTKPIEFKLGAWAIITGTKKQNQGYEETPSHMAICFPNGIVLEARSPRVRLTYIKDFLKYNKIVKSFVYYDVNSTDVILDNALNQFYGKGYDFKAIINYAFFIIRKLLFKKEVPDMKKYQSNKKFYCPELLKVVCNVTSPYLDPNSQMLELLNNDKFTEHQLGV